MPTISDKRRTFRTLHETGCFVIPNPWDVGSALPARPRIQGARHHQRGLRLHQGLPDGAVSRAMMLAHFRDIVAADVPVNADFEGGYGCARGRGRERRVAHR
jgi:2-methylisocitrate lyase-like PEP mutase family enzyme